MNQARGRVYPYTVGVSGQNLPLAAVLCVTLSGSKLALHLAVLEHSGSGHVPSTDFACLLMFPLLAAVHCQLWKS